MSDAGDDAGGVTPTAGESDREAFDDLTLEQFSLGYAAVYHLLPGALLAAGYAVAAPAVEAAGYPPAVAFALVALVVLALELAVLVYDAFRGGRLWGGVVSYAGTPPAGRTLALAGGVAAWVLLVTLGAAGVGAALADAVRGVVPVALPAAGVPDPDAYGEGALTVAAALAVLVGGVVRPVVEELYFRGYLLARLDRLGWWTPVAGAGLFALYHLWAPWLIPVVFVAYLPLAYAVWRTRSVVVGLLARVAVGLAGAWPVLDLVV
jgi:membrane protease YdiL (CAAX protease family)